MLWSIQQVLWDISVERLECIWRRSRKVRDIVVLDEFHPLWDSTATNEQP